MLVLQQTQYKFNWGGLKLKLVSATAHGGRGAEGRKMGHPAGGGLGVCGWRGVVGWLYGVVGRRREASTGVN